MGLTAGNLAVKQIISRFDFWNSLLITLLDFSRSLMKVGTVLI